MPSERISRGFKDISLSFKYNPLTKDIIALKNETAIARSVRNLVLTVNGEVPFNYQKGSQAQRSLFENLDSISASILENQIRRLIEQYEPRVLLRGVSVVADVDMYQYDIVVNYDIVGQPLPVQQLAFALTPTR